MSGLAWLSGLWQDVRHGARVFAKHPGFTAIAIVSIAFGTGANVAMFSLADALLLRPLPVPRPSELVTVGSRVKRGLATLNVMGIMGVTLTMVGLYGLVSYGVSRRTREIGIRVAVGATSGRVLRMILGQGLMPAAAGLVVGLVLSGVTTHALSTLIPLNQQYDPRTFLVVVPLLVLIALLASYAPAQRAASVDPKVALRDE